MPRLLFFFLGLYVFSLVSKPVMRSSITPAMVFTVLGAVAAFVTEAMLGSDHQMNLFLVMAELGLVLLLFADASHMNLALLKNIKGLPTRLLSVGMLLTVGFGIVVALVIFDEISVWHAGILAAVLAPTDAGLGQVIVIDKRVPQKIREALNVEAGLNDGLAVPFLLFFIAMAGNEEASFLGFVVEQLGMGVLIGVIAGRVGGWLAQQAMQRHWIDEQFIALLFLTIPMLCLTLADVLGGSAFIAAFVAGLALPRHHMHSSMGVKFVEEWGQFINLAVFFLFGMLVAYNWQKLELIHFIYGGLSLTVIRMLPVTIALLGSKLQLSTVIFMGWFGPRGLASIVLGLVYFEHMHGQQEELIGAVVSATVLMSIVLHGLTAKFGVTVYERYLSRLPKNAVERED